MASRRVRPVLSCGTRNCHSPSFTSAPNGKSKQQTVPCATLVHSKGGLLHKVRQRSHMNHDIDNQRRVILVWGVRNWVTGPLSSPVVTPVSSLRWLRTILLEVAKGPVDAVIAVILRSRLSGSCSSREGPLVDQFFRELVFQN